MHIGPIDLTQPSTWRGAAGILAVFGMGISPELTEQIAIALAALLSGIEIFRNEYARPQDFNRRESAESADAAFTALPADRQLRPPMPAQAVFTEDLPPPPRFSDR